MADREENILVIKLGAFGDFIQALGPMQAIKKHHNQAHITLLTTKPFVGLAEKSGYFDSIVIDERPKWFQISKLLKLKRTFNAGAYKRVYDLQNNDRTSLYMKLFSPRPEWVGAGKGASHRNTSPERTAGKAFDGHVQTLGLAGVEPVSIDPMDWIDVDLSKLGLQKPYILIVSGSAPQHPQKRWSATNYATLANAFVQQKIQPVLIGTEAERDVTKEIVNLCPDCLDLTGKTSLFDIVGLAKGAKFAIGNDTGPMHMIGPTGCSTLVLFSSHSNPIRHAPLGANVKTMQVDDLNDLSSEEILTKVNFFE